MKDMVKFIDRISCIVPRRKRKPRCPLIIYKSAIFTSVLQKLRFGERGAGVQVTPKVQGDSQDLILQGL